MHPIVEKLYSELLDTNCSVETVRDLLAQIHGKEVNDTDDAGYGLLLNCMIVEGRTEHLKLVMAHPHIDLNFKFRCSYSIYHRICSWIRDVEYQRIFHSDPRVDLKGAFSHLTENYNCTNAMTLALLEDVPTSRLGITDEAAEYYLNQINAPKSLINLIHQRTSARLFAHVRLISQNFLQISSCIPPSNGHYFLSVRSDRLEIQIQLYHMTASLYHWLVETLKATHFSGYIWELNRPLNSAIREELHAWGITLYQQ